MTYREIVADEDRKAGATVQQNKDAGAFADSGAPAGGRMMNKECPAESEQEFRRLYRAILAAIPRDGAKKIMERN